MITNLTQDELVLLGVRHRATYLTAQARFTLGLVEKDPEVHDLVGQAFLGETQAAVDQLVVALHDRDLAAAESHEGGVAQGDALQSAKLWRRTLTQRALAAIVRGVAIPADLGKIGSHGRNPEATALDVERLAKLAKDNLAALAPFHVTKAMVEKGATLAARLRTADTTQELARLSKLPAKVRDLHATKAQVYLALKQINHLARSVHTEDGSGASYNLDILNRRVRRRGADAPTNDPPASPPSGTRPA